MKTGLLFSALLLAGSFGVTNAQVADAYATVAIHSHNDYEHSLPLYEAYSAHSNSIEADIFLADGQLCVAHVKEDVKPERTLTELYLEPIRRQMKLNGGSLYGDDTQVQLLIDLKTDYKTTLPALEKVLKKYRDCFDPSVNKNAVRIVISGHRPAPADFGKYDSMLLFDGDLTTDYSGENGARVPMISVPFFNTSKVSMASLLRQASTLTNEETYFPSLSGLLIATANLATLAFSKLMISASLPMKPDTANEFSNFFITVIF